MMKAGNVKYLLVGVAVLVAPRAFKPTKVLHKQCHGSEQKHQAVVESRRRYVRA